MKAKSDKKLVWVFGGAGALLLAYFFWPKTAAASPVAPAITQAGSQNLVLLQPGATAIGPALGSTVTLQLPSGASWTGLGVNGNGSLTATQFTFVADYMEKTATWTDSAGVARTTTIDVYPNLALPSVPLQ